MKGRESRAAHLFQTTVSTQELDSQGFEEIDLYDRVIIILLKISQIIGVCKQCNLLLANLAQTKQGCA